MGYLEKHYGIKLLTGVEEGLCTLCAVKHVPEQPHNFQSLKYQYNFYDLHGRFPTWKDAMEHCTEEIKALWIAELEKRGETIE